MTIEEARWKLYLHYWSGEGKTKYFKDNIMKLAPFYPSRDYDWQCDVVEKGFVDDLLIEQIDNPYIPF